MSGVVLRCPNCGTTRATAGECQACHEAQVRHCCTNRALGVWLESAACGQCGAQFGDPDRSPAQPKQSARQAPPAPALTPRPRDLAARRPLAGKKPDVDRFDEPSKALHEAPVLRPSTWPDVLRGLARTRRIPSAISPDADIFPATRRAGDCLGRLVLLILVLTSGMFVLGGSVLRMFLPF